MAETDPALLPATECLALFRRKALSPVELARAVIARAEAVAEPFRPLTYTYFEAALEEARAAERRYLGNGPAPRPLEGLCVAIKDTGQVENYPTSFGSLTSDEQPQPRTSTVNARVLSAGGIMHARSATPEFSSAAFTHSRRWGVSRNPWNPEFTPGGSSGGAGAALALGAATLATGSDIGGSIRIPASCCGVVGYKPPRGRNPVDPPFNLDFYCHTGPMARNVADTILLQNVMCGPHPSDVTALDPKLELALHYPPIEGWRIAYSLDLGFYELSADVRANTLAALERFRAAGAVTEEIALGWDGSAADAALAYLRHIFGISLAPVLAAHAEKLTSYARQFAETGQASTAADYFASLTKAGEIGMDFGAAMQGYDIFVCPTTAIAAVPAEFDHSRDRLEINGVEVEPMLGWAMTPLFNMLSSHPVLSVPSGLAENGVPTGIQIVGRPYRDADVFRAALAYEAAARDLFPSSYGRADAGPAAGRVAEDAAAASSGP